MKRDRSGRYTILLAAFGLVLGAGVRAAPGTHDDAAPHWEYDGKTGPAAWGALSPEFATCSVGQRQSPIDLAGASPAATTALRAAFPPATVEIHPAARPAGAVHNGHTIQVDFPGGDTLTVGGVPFELVQFHVHAPSEHTVAGRHLPMEIHFVHRSAAGKLAVLGVLVEKGAKNAAFATIESALPKTEGAIGRLERVPLGLGGFFPKEHAIDRYEGSLTTPPCSEQVSWLVMMTAIELSAEQIATVSAALPDNSRPVQSLNGRVLVSDQLTVRTAAH